MNLSKKQIDSLVAGYKVTVSDVTIYPPYDRAKWLGRFVIDTSDNKIKKIVSICPKDNELAICVVDDIYKRLEYLTSADLGELNYPTISQEDYDMICRENKAMAEYLETHCKLSKDEISDICNGAIL